VQRHVVLIDDERDKAAWAAVGVIGDVRINGDAGGLRFRAHIRNVLGADDAEQLPVDSDRKVRRAQVIDRLARVVDYRHVHFQHFDTRSKHRWLCGLLRGQACDAGEGNNQQHADPSAHLGNLDIESPQRGNLLSMATTSAASRFLRYVTYDTQSDENSKTYPSTEKQLVLLKQLVKELQEIG